MLTFNQNLINLTQQEEAKRKEYEAIQERLKEERKKVHDTLAAKEQALIIQVNNLYRNEIHKFTAKLSEDMENVEIYSQSKKLVGLYTKKNNQFSPLELTIIGFEKQEDIILGRTKQQLYTIMENLFR